MQSSLPFQIFKTIWFCQNRAYDRIALTQHNVVKVYVRTTQAEQNCLLTLIRTLKILGGTLTLLHVCQQNGVEGSFPF